MDRPDRPIEEDFLIIPTRVRTPEGIRIEILAVPIENLRRGISASLLTPPKIVLSCMQSTSTLCVVGSVVYMFGNQSRAVGSFHLSTFLRRTEVKDEVVLEDAMIRKIAPMKKPKCCVGAVPTPDGKLLAFSRYRVHGAFDFELYDPCTDSWEDIPELEQQLQVPRSFDQINSFAFVDTNAFVVNRRGKTYHLILKEPTNTSFWEDFGFLDCPNGSGFSHRFRGGGFELTLIEGAIWDNKNFTGHCKCVLTFKPAFNRSYIFKSRRIISGGRWSHCYVIETAKDPEYGECFLSIREYELELVEYFRKKNALEKKFYEDLECGSLDTFPELGGLLISSSMFYLPRGSNKPHILDDVTTFSI